MAGTGLSYVVVLIYLKGAERGKGRQGKILSQMEWVRNSSWGIVEVTQGCHIRGKLAVQTRSLSHSHLELSLNAGLKTGKRQLALR